MNLMCGRCKLSSFCPAKGSSPLKTSKGNVLQCNLIGNFGRKPINKAKLSKENLAKAEKYGFCTSYIEIPREDEPSKKIYLETMVIFHEPILHSREKPIIDIVNRKYRRSHKI